MMDLKRKSQAAQLVTFFLRCSRVHVTVTVCKRDDWSEDLVSATTQDRTRDETHMNHPRCVSFQWYWNSAYHRVASHRTFHSHTTKSRSPALSFPLPSKHPYFHPTHTRTGTHTRTLTPDHFHTSAPSENTRLIIRRLGYIGFGIWVFDLPYLWWERGEGEN